MADTTPPKPTEANGPIGQPPEQGQKEPPAFVQNPNDPWAAMFKEATPEEVQKFKEGVYQAVGHEMARQKERMIKAIKKMGKDED